MKNIKLSALAIFLLFLAGCYVAQPVASQPPPPPPPPPPAQDAPGGYQSFYDELAPYGTWVEHPRYGYVWIPNVGPDFRPYCTDGYWAYSDLGWTWVSYYSWGWAPFHYGRWFEEPGYGWMWVPGNDWAPAWVAWGNYNGYYGWAPLQPAYAVGGGVYPPIQNWYFTDARYMGDRNWSNHYYYAQNNRIVMNNNIYIEDVHNINMINNSSNYNNRVYNAGPRREEVENISRQPIQTVQIRDNNQPGKSEINNGALNIYRPRVSSTGNNTAKPNKTVPLENVRQGNPAPEKQQQQRTPEMNRPQQPGNSQAPIPQRGNAEPGRGQQEMSRPATSPQQPRQENTAPPAQQQNNHTPAQTNIRPGTAPMQQQQGKGASKGKNKQAKQPVKGRQNMQGAKPTDKPVQEKKE